ncbi:hypothetical protein ABHN03_03855 [Paenibacillus sp. NRS-1775]|uniref:hypothetical protein n=1 Tax=unclassified Paenibacillus TaxID=185978 RepID=UPI003D28B0E9
MRTEEKLHEEMGTSKHDWQTKKLIQVEDLSFVIQNLLTNKFVVEINGHMYDIAFGVKRKKIAYGWSSSPSPHLNTCLTLNLTRNGITISGECRCYVYFSLSTLLCRLCLSVSP